MDIENIKNILGNLYNKRVDGLTDRMKNEYYNNYNIYPNIKYDKYSTINSKYLDNLTDHTLNNYSKNYKNINIGEQGTYTSISRQNTDWKSLLDDYVESALIETDEEKLEKMPIETIEKFLRKKKLERIKKKKDK